MNKFKSFGNAPINPNNKAFPNDLKNPYKWSCVEEMEETMQNRRCLRDSARVS